MRMIYVEAKFNFKIHNSINTEYYKQNTMAGTE